MVSSSDPNPHNQKHKPVSEEVSSMSTEYSYDQSAAMTQCANISERKESTITEKQKNIPAWALFCGKK